MFPTSDTVSCSNPACAKPLVRVEFSSPNAAKTTTLNRFKLKQFGEDARVFNLCCLACDTNTLLERRLARAFLKIG